ncbi:hypothetical protein NKH18_39915 [Streptomyces sp. M10(2022)]
MLIHPTSNKTPHRQLTRQIKTPPSSSRQLPPTPSTTDRTTHSGDTEPASNTT